MLEGKIKLFSYISILGLIFMRSLVNQKALDN